MRSWKPAVVRVTCFSTLCAALLTGCSGQPTVKPGAESPAPGTAAVRVENAWVRPVDVDGTTAGYFTLVNDSPDSLVLVGVDVPAAASSMMHETVKDSVGMMSMQHVERFMVAPHARLEFTPGGNHIMAMQSYIALAEGDTTGLDLHFADGRSLHVTAQVRTSSE